jgi:hypothetical protein
VKYFSYKEIEDRAENRVLEYSRKFEAIKEPPVPIDQIIELLFGLTISWEEIDDNQTIPVWGGLRPTTKEIVLNEKHLAVFKEKPGLERFTKGHELGHWDLFIDKSYLDHPVLPGFNKTDFFINRTAQKGLVQLVRDVLIDHDAYKVLKKHLSKIDPPYLATAVDKYASVISMPCFLLTPIAKDLNLKHWPSLYELAKLFDVTISALTVRLQQLKLIFISKDNSIHNSKEEYYGQGNLFK